MKQTAVEFLERQLIKIGLDIDKNVLKLIRKSIEQAKEIENQQQDKNKYSEEELKSAFRIGFSIGYGSTVQELDLKNEYCEKWFEKFGKK